jgi:YfiH family protein
MILLHPSKRFIYSTKINDSDYFSAFSTKLLKSKEDNSEIADFLTSSNIPYKAVFRKKQVHGSDVKVVSFSDKDVIDSVDGMVTTEKGNVLVIRTADCVPVLFVDKEAGVIGASHHGWQGTFKNITREILQKMEQMGASRERIIAAIGPSIGACCYNIPEERYTLFKEKFPQYIEKIIVKRNNRYFLDLYQLNYLLLLENGIKSENIDHRNFCTQCDEEHFFSFRRDYHSNKNAFGHMVNFIVKV